ncbi:sulfotransferase [Pirellulaceae bacterium]|nr:sulfotransferase [Pirellulaceae bacterium]
MSEINSKPNRLAVSVTKTSSRANGTDKRGMEKIPKVSAVTPRPWHGMRFLSYLGLLKAGRFRIHFLGLGMAISIFFFSMVTSVMAMLQNLVWGRRIRAAKIQDPPVFVIGHWRSGTTLVHELLSLDDRLTAPSTYQVFAPGHFLISESWLKTIVGWTLPATRQLDNMATGPDRPQEDEFAICALGAPSPYSSMAFPNLPLQNQNTIDMKGVSKSDRQRLRKAICYFAKALTSRGAGRLVLKSPTHTGRVEFLRSVFPGAKFIHISREPLDVIPSTMRLWRHLDSINGFQIPNYPEDGLRERVFNTFKKMDEAYEEQASDCLDDICQLKYEDIVTDPVRCLGKAYDELGLEGFDELSPKITKEMESRKGYKKNTHQLDNDLRQEIETRCRGYRERHGYV